MGAIYEFGVRRNARVINARLRGTANAALARTWRLFGRQFHKRPPISAYGVPMVANYSDKTFRYCLYGTYGKYLSDYLDALDQPFAFLDIGANQGLYSLVAARNPQCRRIVAVEPVAPTFALLEANLLLGGASTRTAAVNAALSDRCGEVAIAVKPNHSGVASIAAHAARRGRPTQAIRLVDIAALDALLPPALPIYAKVDVEGHEAVVIAELLRSKHAGRIKAVFHEMDERWADAGEIRALLEGAGFTRFRKFGIRRHYDVLAER